MTTPTNIRAWQQALTTVLKLHSCCKANIEHRTLLILACFLSLAYLQHIYPMFASQLQTLYYQWPNISQVKVQYTATSVQRMRLYDVGKDHEESMRLISNVHLIA